MPGVKNIINSAIALVWLINGLYCKLLNLVPRHKQIVARILVQEHAGLFTKAIGISEILMAFWIVSRIQSRWCAIVQIALIATMNTIEYFLAPDLLLFGRVNALLALLLITIIALNEFALPFSSRGKGQDIFAKIIT